MGIPLVHVYGFWVTYTQFTKGLIAQEGTQQPVAARNPQPQGEGVVLLLGVCVEGVNVCSPTSKHLQVGTEHPNWARELNMQREPPRVRDTGSNRLTQRLHFFEE